MESVVAGKARVHELAKELGVTSKEVLARLSEQGEFVKSASSTVEAPVARRLREAFGGGKAKQAGNGAVVKKSAAGAPAKATTARAATAGAGSPGRRCAGTQPGGASRTHGQPASRPCSQARCAHAARGQQPVLLRAADRPADPAPAAPPTRCAASRWYAPGGVARQHAAAARWRRARPCAAARCSSYRPRWPRPRWSCGWRTSRWRRVP